VVLKSNRGAAVIDKDKFAKKITTAIKDNTDDSIWLKCRQDVRTLAQLPSFMINRLRLWSAHEVYEQYPFLCEDVWLQECLSEVKWTVRFFMSMITLGIPTTDEVSPALLYLCQYLENGELTVEQLNIMHMMHKATGESSFIMSRIFRTPIIDTKKYIAPIENILDASQSSPVEIIKKPAVTRCLRHLADGDPIDYLTAKSMCSIFDCPFHICGNDYELMFVKYTAIPIYSDNMYHIMSLDNHALFWVHKRKRIEANLHVAFFVDINPIHGQVLVYAPYLAKLFLVEKTTGLVVRLLFNLTGVYLHTDAETPEGFPVRILKVFGAFATQMEPSLMTTECIELFVRFCLILMSTTQPKFTYEYCIPEGDKNYIALLLKHEGMSSLELTDRNTVLTAAELFAKHILAGTAEVHQILVAFCKYTIKGDGKECKTKVTPRALSYAEFAIMDKYSKPEGRTLSESFSSDEKALVSVFAVFEALRWGIKPRSPFFEEFVKKAVSIKSLQGARFPLFKINNDPLGDVIYDDECLFVHESAEPPEFMANIDRCIWSNIVNKVIVLPEYEDVVKTKPNALLQLLQPLQLLEKVAQKQS
jgi:hypothetical protein